MEKRNISKKDWIVGVWLTITLILLSGEPQTESTIALVAWYGFIIANLAGVSLLAKGKNANSKYRN